MRSFSFRLIPNNNNKIDVSWSIPRFRMASAQFDRSRFLIILGVYSFSLCVCSVHCALRFTSTYLMKAMKIQYKNKSLLQLPRERSALGRMKYELDARSVLLRASVFVQYAISFVLCGLVVMLCFKALPFISRVFCGARYAPWAFWNLRWRTRIYIHKTLSSLPGGPAAPSNHTTGNDSADDPRFSLSKITLSKCSTFG